MSFPIIEFGPRRPIHLNVLSAAAALVLAVAALASEPGDDRAPRAAAPSSPSEPCHRPWTPPVDAPITDPYRPPDHRYGPGNRGIEYGTDPGDEVVAVADGVVEFAGPVAGRPVVVLAHGAGLRSSYVNLDRGLVARGETVARGQRIANADVAFHLGARQGRRYIDPARLIDRLCLVVRLVA